MTKAGKQIKASRLLALISCKSVYVISKNEDKEEKGMDLKINLLHQQRGPGILWDINLTERSHEIKSKF